MAELATTDGLPLPADLPRGECVVTRLDDGRLRIDHADPRILASNELLDVIALHNALVDGTEALALNATLRWPSPPPATGRFLYIGAVLTIHGVNRTVIYRITEYVPRVRGYIAEWPD